MGNQLIARWRWGSATARMHPFPEQQHKQEDISPEGDTKERTRLGSIFRAATSARKSWRKARNQRYPSGSDGGGGGYGGSFATVAAAEDDLLPDGADDGIFRRRVHHFEKDTIKANWMNEGGIGCESAQSQVRWMDGYSRLICDCSN